MAPSPRRVPKLEKRTKRVPKLEKRTKRLVLRPMRATDYVVWRTACLTRPAPKNEWDRPPRTEREVTRAEFRKILRGQSERRRGDSFYELSIFLHDGRLIGAVSFMDVKRGVSQDAFIGYGIFNPYWGRGYAREALRAAFEIGFRKLGLHRIEAGIEPRNRRSIALARAVGMRKEGLKERLLFLRGAWRDHLMYTVTCEDLGWKYRGPRPTFERRG